MSKVLANVQVEDLDRFWEVFTSRGAEQREAFGSSGATVFCEKEDGNHVWVLFDWEPDRYKEFTQDERTPEIFRAAGLKGPPEAIFVDDVGETRA